MTQSLEQQSQQNSQQSNEHRQRASRGVRNFGEWCSGHARRERSGGDARSASAGLAGSTRRTRRTRRTGRNGTRGCGNRSQAQQERGVIQFHDGVGQARALDNVRSQVDLVRQADGSGRASLDCVTEGLNANVVAVDLQDAELTSGIERRDAQQLLNDRGDLLRSAGGLVDLTLGNRDSGAQTVEHDVVESAEPVHALVGGHNGDGGGQRRGRGRGRRDAVARTGLSGLVSVGQARVLGAEQRLQPSTAVALHLLAHGSARTLNETLLVASGERLQARQDAQPVLARLSGSGAAVDPVLEAARGLLILQVKVLEFQVVGEASKAPAQKPALGRATQLAEPTVARMVYNVGLLFK